MRFLMSAENFIKIFYKENKKGKPLEYCFREEMGEILGISEEIRKNKDKEKNLQDKREKLIKKFSLIEKGIVNINIEIESCPKPIKDKKIYRYKTNKQNALSIYLIDKQIQSNLQIAFKFRMNNHTKIISQMLALLNDDMPKHIYRTDIKDFFESIPHDKLKGKISKNAKLDTFSKNVIFNILDQYSNIVQADVGIPRGIGLSSCLAEIYLLDLDYQMRFNQKVFFYSRFVDDIVVFAMESIKEDIENSIRDIGLTNNQDKTKVKHKTKDRNASFEFLGYHFNANGSRARIEMSKKKIEKIKYRISRAVKDYNLKAKNKKSNSEAMAWRLLNQRLRFLTGNTSLANVKSSVFVGIYYSNLFLSNNSSSLKKLDAILCSELQKIKIPAILNGSKSKSVKKLEQYSFQNGFDQKIFHSFCWRQIHQITKIWKY